MKKGIMLTLASLCIAGAAMADVPFRLHRYDSFRATPVNSESIVFYGNSITNMNEWWECFGDDHRIINRGNSGGYTQEMLDNAESIILGQPAKIFVGIGTNDLGTAGIDNAEYVSGNIRKLITRFKEESPRTEVYIQSILPSNNGLRNDTKTIVTNAAVKEVCEELGATYVDLFDDMQAIHSGTISYDDLHVTAKGYQIWCNKIAPLVGVECSYPATFTENASGMAGSNGMRSTSWSVQTVRENDVLIIGDEMIHGGEWHELFNSPYVKDRGIGWGYGGYTLTQWATNIDAILGTNAARKTAPAAICLYMGVAATNGTDDLNTAANQYQAVINKIRTYAPAEKTKIIIMSLLPRTTATNNTRIATFNNSLQVLAANNDNTEYANIYTPLLTGAAANTAYITADYLYGRGYNKVAQILAPMLPVETKVLTDEEFEAHYALVMARTDLANALDQAQRMVPGDGAGEYSAEALATVLEKIAEAKAVLADPNSTLDAVKALSEPLSQAVNAAKSAINQPKGGDEIVYTLRDYRLGYYATENGGALIGTADVNSAYGQWKLIARGDGTFDIVNCQSGNYVNNTAAYDTQLTTSATAPATGWKFSACDGLGMYIITNGTVQFNQTQSGLGYKIYNYGSGTNTDDTGCQYILTEAEPIEPIAPPKPGEDNSNPEFTLTDIECTGTPVKIADEYAIKVLRGGNAQSMAMEITVNSNSGRSAIVSACDSLGGGYHFSLFVNDLSGFGTVYHGLTNKLEGWFTRSFSLSGKHQLVFVCDPASGYYYYYVDGTAQNVGPESSFAAYGLATFGLMADDTANALYLGGTKHSDTTNKHNLSNATIHSVRFYNRALTSTEVSLLNWEGLLASNDPQVGLSEISAPESAATGIFDIAGRRLEKATAPGLYIIDGQKTFVK